MLLLSSQTAHAQEQRYRVELLVLRHLDGHSAAQPATGLTDFSSALDLLAPPDAGLPQEPVELLPAQPGAGPPPAILLRQTPGEVMQQAWQRLRSANGLRPELYFSWEQSISAGAPEIRIHDQVLVAEPSPYLDEQSVAAFKPAGSAGAGFEANAEFADAGLLPGSPQYYRLDGTARLRVARFLRLDLNIEYREPLDESLQHGAPMPASSAPGQLEPAAGYTVYTIRQSRQLQIQDLQYFDGPAIAVLATVTRVEPLPEQNQ